jgi:tRNA (mo5U34)-methyltransferase
LLALDIVREITLRQMVLQTMTMPGERVITPPDSVPLDERAQLTRRGWPHLAFIEHAVENDPTNWWAPNHACVEAMVRAAGFTVRARPGHEIYVCEPNAGEPEVRRHLREVELRALRSNCLAPSNGERP